MTQEEASALGWRGDALMFRTFAANERVARAVEDYARSLGLDVTRSPGGQSGGVHSEIWQVKTGTPEKWLAADRLCAYAWGLADALSDAYGQPWSLAAQDRRVSDGQPGSAP